MIRKSTPTRHFFKLKPFISTFCVASCLVATNVQAVEGYKDIYLDREQDIQIHSIFCGDFNRPNTLKQSYVYTNTATIEEGTYYYGTKWGNYSYTFKPIEGQPEQIRIRGLLREGQTSKDQMVIDTCLVDKLAGLPPKLINSIGITTLSKDDPQWDKTMTQYATVAGRPAFAKGVYTDTRSTKVHQDHDQTIFDANQNFLKNAQQHFEQESSKLAAKLPEQLNKAIEYVHQQDGKPLEKRYPPIEKPAVWTPIAEERYQDAVRRQSQEKQWDHIIQKNFDWFFKNVGRANSLTATELLPPQAAQWQGQQLIQVHTVVAKFENGKQLELDFTMTSGKVDKAIFDTMEQIQQKSHLARETIIASQKKQRQAVDPSHANELDVYSNVEKQVIFFSPFREKPQGDHWRIKE